MIEGEIFMKLKDLEYFYQLAQFKSFTRVAKYFEVSQPTISYAVKRLEEELQCDLIIKDPSHRNVVLTQQGEIFVKQAEEVLILIQTSINKVRQSLRPEVSVGFPPIISNYIFNQLISKDYSLQDLSNIKMVRGGSRALMLSLENGKLDLSLLGSLEPLENTQLVINPLFEKDFYIVVSRKHPLAKQKEISFADVLDEKFILLDEQNIHLQAFKRLNHRYMDQAKALLKIDDVQVIKEMVKKNMGITLLSDIALSEDDETELVKIPLIKREKTTFYASYAYPKNLVLSQDLVNFINILNSLE